MSALLSLFLTGERNGGGCAKGSSAAYEGSGAEEAASYSPLCPPPSFTVHVSHLCGRKRKSVKEASLQRMRGRTRGIRAEQASRCHGYGEGGLTQGAFLSLSHTRTCSRTRSCLPNLRPHVSLVSFRLLGESAEHDAMRFERASRLCSPASGYARPVYVSMR